jgi:tetratricopeptide (TPR) repeat protein
MLDAIEGAMAAQNWTLAADLCRQQIADHPTSAKLYAYLGWCEIQLNRPAAAVQPLRTAVILEPHYWQASLQLAQLLDRLGRYAEALQAANDALREKPGHPQIVALVRGLERQVPEEITDAWQVSTKPIFYTIELTQRATSEPTQEAEQVAPKDPPSPALVIKLFPKADPAG